MIVYHLTIAARQTTPKFSKLKERTIVSQVFMGLLNAFVGLGCICQDS